MQIGAMFEDTQHGLQIPCDFFEPGGVARFSTVEAVINVIVDQRALCVCDCLFNRVHLLGDISAGAALFNHIDNAGQMPIGPFEAGHDFRV